MSSGAATVRQWSADIQRFVDDWPAQGGDVLARAVDEQLRADTGGDGAFSRGKTLGRADVGVEAGRTSADVFGAGSIGLWTILENGTEGHTVTAQRGRLLATPYGPRPSVTVSGVPARHTWSRGVEAGMGLVERDADQAWSQVGG